MHRSVNMTNIFSIIDERLKQWNEFRVVFKCVCVQNYVSRFFPQISAAANLPQNFFRGLINLTLQVSTVAYFWIPFFCCRCTKLEWSNDNDCAVSRRFRSYFTFNICHFNISEFRNEFVDCVWATIFQGSLHEFRDFAKSKSILRMIQIKSFCTQVLKISELKFLSTSLLTLNLKV